MGDSDKIETPAEKLANELTDLIIEYNTLAGIDKNLQMDRNMILSECVHDTRGGLDTRKLHSRIRNLKVNIHTMKQHRKRFRLMRLEGPAGQSIVDVSYSYTDTSNNITFHSGTPATKDNQVGPVVTLPAAASAGKDFFSQPDAPYEPEESPSGTFIVLSWKNEERDIMGNGLELPFINGIRIDASSNGSGWTHIKDISKNETSVRLDAPIDISTNTTYEFRVYGFNDITDETTLNALEFPIVSTTTIGPPGPPIYISNNTVTVDSIYIYVAKPKYNDINNKDETSPDIQDYRLSYNATESLRYGGIYGDSHSGSESEIKYNPVITIPNLYPGTTYDISAAAKNTVNNDYGEAVNSVSPISTNLPNQTALLDSSNSSLSGGDSYNLLRTSSQSPILVHGVFKNSIRGSKTALTNTNVNLNGEKVGVDASGVVSTFTLTTNGNTQVDGSNNKNIIGFNNLPLSGNDGDLIQSYATMTLSNTSDPGTNEFTNFNIDGSINLVVDLNHSDIEAGIEHTVTLSSTSSRIGTQTRTFYVDTLSGDPDVSVNNVTLTVDDENNTTQFFGLTSVDEATVRVDASINNFAHYFVPTDNIVAQTNLETGDSTGTSNIKYTGDPNPGIIDISQNLTYTKSGNYVGVINGKIQAHSVVGSSDHVDFETSQLVYSDASNNPTFNSNGTLMSTGSGEFPELSTINSVYQHEDQIPDNQLIFTDGEWRSGGDSSAFRDYGETYDNPGINYSVESIKDEGDTWDGNTTPIKWVTLKFLHPETTTEVSFTNLNLEDVSYAYIIESEIENGNEIRKTPWRDMNIEFNSGEPNWDPDNNEILDGSGGAKILNENLQFEGKFQIKFKGNNDTYVYIRIGLPANSQVTFGRITMN